MMIAASVTAAARSGGRPDSSAIAAAIRAIAVTEYGLSTNWASRISITRRWRR